jgi:hypothetical protein
MVREVVRTKIVGKIIIGHCLWDSFELLQLSHPACDTRDVATFAPFRRSLNYPLSGDVSSYDDCPSLKDVMEQVMRRNIRLGYDSTVCHAILCISTVSPPSRARTRELAWIYFGRSRMSGKERSARTAGRAYCSIHHCSSATLEFFHPFLRLSSWFSSWTIVDLLPYAE